MITIFDALVHSVTAHSLAAYPNEACGILLGVFGPDGTRDVTQTMGIENSREAEEQYHRFRITPADYMAAEDEAGKQGLEILGFYHSHPDHPAVPSDYDRDHAFPGLSYIIVSVEGDEPAPRVVRVASWELRPDRTAFDHEKEILFVPGDTGPTIDSLVPTNN